VLVLALSTTACASDSVDATNPDASSAGASNATGGAPDTGGAGVGGSSGSGADGVDEPLGDFEITELRVEHNPNSVLSCFVSWITDLPTSSEVQFGVDGYQFRVHDDAELTEHRVLVIGMHAETEYSIRALSRTRDGYRAEETSFTTPALPTAVPGVQLTMHDETLAQPGWTLTNVMAGDPALGTDTPAVIVMYDQTGLPVWYYINGTTPEVRGDISADLLDDGNVLVGATKEEPPREIDLAGNVVWEGPPQSTVSTGSPVSHHASKLSNGNYILLRDHPVDSVLGVLIDEVDAANEVVWFWDLFDHADPGPDPPWDWCHGNSVSVDLERDVFYLSCRWLGLFKVSRSGDQDIIWRMGPNGDVAFEPESMALRDMHDPEIHDDGTILFYDNGGFNLQGGEGYESRVAEYALDEDALHATLVWAFPGDFDVDPWYRDEWYTPLFGDADRLDNDNVLITAGVFNPEQSSRIFEVTRAGDVAWEVIFPQGMGIYRAERLVPPPLVEPVSD